MDFAWQALVELLILLLAAMIFGTLAEMLRQHAIVGYLVAGALVGPNVLGLVESRDHVFMIAELGVALLLFNIGLEFSFRRLRQLGALAVIGGTLQVVVTMFATAAVAGAFGLGPRAALAVGMMVAMSSTACVLRLLMDRSVLESAYGRGAVGVLLLQDVAVVPLMLLMATMTGGGGIDEMAWELGRTTLFATVMIGSFYLLFNVIAPRVMNIRQWSKNRELPILLAIVMALGSATIAHRLHISTAMGAFLAGILLAESPFAVQVRADVGSLRTVMVTLFFAAMGMFAEPLWVAAHWYIVLGSVMAIIVGKAAIIWGIGRALRQPHGVSLATGLCLAQVGEFSFVLAKIARGPLVDGARPAAIITEDTFRLIISATILTLFLTPYFVKNAPHWSRWIEDLLAAPRRRRKAQRSEPASGEHTGMALSGAAARVPASSVEQPTSSSVDVSPPPPDDRILIVGFGPAGQRVAEALIGRCRERLVILDVNPRNLSLARSYGLDTRLGDATQIEVLEHADLPQVSTIVITLPDAESARSVIHLCRTLRPEARIIARARYHVFRWELHLAGAEVVIDEEDQVGLRIAAEVWRFVHRENEQA